MQGYTAGCYPYYRLVMRIIFPEPYPPGPLYTLTKESRGCGSPQYLIGSDTNLDTNPHEQRRTYATRQQKKYAYLQEFLNIGEQARHPRLTIPLNGVSRVRIPPPPLSFLPFCRINPAAKKRTGLLPARFTPPYPVTYHAQIAHRPGPIR